MHRRFESGAPRDGAPNDASWPEIIVSDLDELSRAVRPYASQGLGQFRRFAFRGQPDAGWRLRPTFARELRAYQDRTGKPLPSPPLVFESWLLQQFRQKAHLYAPVESLVRGNTDVDWMVMGRHHGLPSRLLDWSYSPYAAAWMACADAPEADGAIWCVSVDHVNSTAASGSDALMFGAGAHLERIVRGEDADPTLLFFTPSTHNRRSASQQGIFSIDARGDRDHDELIAAVQDRHALEPDRMRARFRIRAAAKRETVRALRSMNVTAETLQPDLDGCCRELLELLRDYPEEVALDHRADSRPIEDAHRARDPERGR